MIEIDDRNSGNGMSPIFLPSNFIDPEMSSTTVILGHPRSVEVIKSSSATGGVLKTFLKMHSSF